MPRLKNNSSITPSPGFTWPSFPLPEIQDAKMQSNLIERADGTVHSTNSPTDGQKAISHYTMISSDKLRLLQVQLYTGRKHQIRVHLSELASAIVGDTVYGGVPTHRPLVSRRRASA